MTIISNGEVNLMRIKPYDETIDRSNLVDLMNQMNKHFDPENSLFMTIESLNLNLSTNDLTVLSRDFLVVKDNQEKLIGFTGFYKSSLQNWWQVEFVISPEYLTTSLSGELIDAILKLAKEQAAPELHLFGHTSFLTLHSKFKSLGVKPAQYFWMMGLDDFSSVTKSVLPASITIRRQKGDEDYAGYAVAANEAFRESFEYSPTTEEIIRLNAQVNQDTGLELERFFALDEEKIVGFIIVMVSPNPEQKEKGTISFLGVMPSHQRRGIGSALMSVGIQWLREKGCEKIDLGVRASNEDALTLYKKFGFYELETKWMAYTIKQSE